MSSSRFLLFLVISAFENSSSDTLLKKYPLRELPAPTQLERNTTFVYLRVQKTASKTLVRLLEKSPWLRSPESCPKTGWLGQTTSSCTSAVRSVLRNSAHRRVQNTEAQEVDLVAPCLIDGHCGLDVLTVTAFETAINVSPKLGASSVERFSTPFASRPFVITLLREPVARVLSE